MPFLMQKNLEQNQLTDNKSIKKSKVQESRKENENSENVFQLYQTEEKEATSPFIEPSLQHEKDSKMAADENSDDEAVPATKEEIIISELRRKSIELGDLDVKLEVLKSMANNESQFEDEEHEPIAELNSRALHNN